MDEYLTIYMRGNCRSSRKAINFCEEHQISYMKKNIEKDGISKNDLLNILSSTEEGFSEILRNGKSLEEVKKNIDLDELSLTDMFTFLQNNTKLIKTPINVKENKIVIGFNSEIMRVFIPREEKKKILKELMCVASQIPLDEAYEEQLA